MELRKLVIEYIGLLALVSYCGGEADPSSNSFISPKSANHENIWIPQLPENSATEALRHIQSTASPVDVKSHNHNKITQPENEIAQSVVKERLERSALPILTKTSGGDNLLLFKNVEESLESNDVEMSGRIGNFIQPSKTDKNSQNVDFHSTQEPSSGEERGALQGRSLHEPQEISPSVTMRTFATHSPRLDRPRQANPDIQDIITGIVKLLNGNVNVQANTAPGMGRPLRPLSTRINNRGPPRISDVPVLPPDFDVPAPPLPPPALGPVPPMATRPPYPFDLPPSNMSPKRPYIGTNIPLTEQSSLGNKRPSPGFYRPVTMPPWNRRRPSKRPNPDIPPYKPLPISNSDMVSFTSEAPMDDILTLDMGTQFDEHHPDKGHDENGYLQHGKDQEHHSQDNNGSVTDLEKNYESHSEVTTNTVLEASEEIDKDISDFEKNKEKKPDKTTKVTLVTPTVKTDNSILDIPTSLATDESSSSKLSQNTQIEPTSVSKEIIPNTYPVNRTDAIKENVSDIVSTRPILESSIQESILHDDMTNPSSSIVATRELPSIGKKGQNQTFVLNHTSTGAASLSIVETSQAFPYQPYRPRPGIVLDDTEYKPGQNRLPVITRPPISGAAVGESFDVTLTAIQGPGDSSSGQGQPYVIPIDIEQVNSNSDVITTPVGEEGFVSINGERTYINLFGDQPGPTSITSIGVKPSTPSDNNVVQGTTYVEQDKLVKPNYGSVKPALKRPTYGRPKPSQPPVRIDTCIVGDDSTCDVSQHEMCRTEAGVSACHCRPGTARRKHRDPCRKIVSVLLSLRVDRIYERRIGWASELLEKSSESYEQLSYEAERALESAMSMTPFSDEYLGSKVNNIFQGDRSQGQAGVFVNITLQLEENAETSRPSVKGDIQKHLLGVIQRRSNNVGNSALWVDSPPGSVSSLQDLDECSSPDLHDCHPEAECINTFGSFKCECKPGLRDPWSDNKHRAGRHCEQCAAAYCNNRGECKYLNGQETCSCTGNYYGNQCELDGEVLGVAIGASVAAIIIIGLTLVCLVMWSRKWSREQKAAVGSPVFGYMASASNTVKTPVVGNPPYQLTLEDRLRWAQIADVMAQANHYAPEPGHGPTRPSSAMFGYPTLPMNNTLQRHPGSLYGGATGTLPPVPLPRLNLQATLTTKAASMQGMRPLDNSSSSEEEDKIDLLGRNFHVPRPKSRSSASIANQSGIYYDVDYDQNEVYKPSGIPMSTYGRAPFFRNS